MQRMRIFIFLFILGFGFEVNAQVLVVDGDSLEKGHERIRLNGIDAPEYNQPCWDEKGVEYDCGAESTKFLKNLVKGKKIRCEYLKKDQYKRDLSECFAGDVNINKEMVAQGWAVSYDIDGDGYPDEEKTAKEQKRGVWRGKFMRPELWRRLTKD